MKKDQASSFSLEIQFEDVDFGGGVHHPKYLYFFERARNYGLSQLGFDSQQKLKSGFVFVVRQQNIDFQKPLFWGDKINIKSWISEIGGSFIKVRQIIMKEGSDSELDLEKLWNNSSNTTRLESTLIYLELSRMKPAKLPNEIRDN